MTSSAGDEIRGVGEIPILPSMGFDVGFQHDGMNNVENALGYAAINTEQLYQGLADSLDKHINQAYTNTAMVQTSLHSQVTNSLQQAKDNTTKLQQALETSLAGQMGMPYEATQVVAPNNRFMQETLSATSLPDQSSIPRIPVNPPTIPPHAPPLGPGQPPIVNLPPVRPPFPPPPSGWNCVGWPPPSSNCQAYINFGQQPGQALYTGGNWTSGPITIVCPGNNDPAVGPITIPSIYNPPCTVGGPPIVPVPGPPIILPPTLPPPVTPTPPCPTPPPCPPSSCPPVIKFPECIKVCDVTPKKKPEEPVYQVCCDPNTHVITVVLRSDTSTCPGTVIAEGTASSIDWRAICNSCPIEQQPTLEPTPIITPLQFQPGQGCGGLLTFPLLANFGANTTWYDIFLQAISDTQANTPPSDSTIQQTITDAGFMLFGATGSVLDGIVNVLSNILGGVGCTDPTAISAFATRALYGLASKFVGDAVAPIDTVAKYAQNSACPFLLPTADQATRQYLTESIDADRLRCLVEANGYRWDTWTAMVDSTRTRWNPAEAIMLWRRNKITLQQCDDSLRQLGYLGAPERQGLRELSEQVPAVSDLMSMMIRDVADEINVDWTASDALFGVKYAGQLRTWGENQGIPDLMAKYIWRAHWTIPSPTQLFEFWHRLRNNPAYGPPAKLFQRIRNALIQQDILPDWIDAFIDVSFRPLTRVDSKRAFALGVLDEDGLSKAFKDQGYSDDNAGTMVDYTVAQLRAQVARNPLLKKYAAGELNGNDLRKRLALEGLPEEFITLGVDVAQSLLTQNTRKVCVSAIQKRYMLGEIDSGEVNQWLVRSGLDTEQVSALSAAFDCVKSARGKAIPANTLCGWYERGAINEVDLYSRLLKLGYTQDDAAGLTRDCMTRVGMKLDKEKAAQLKREALQARQEQRAAAQAAAALNRAINQAARNTEKAQSIQQQRQKDVINIGRLWSDKTGKPLGDAVLFVKRLVNQQAATGLAPIPTIIMAAKAAAQDGNILTDQDFINQMAIAITDVTS